MDGGLSVITEINYSERDLYDAQNDNENFEIKDVKISAATNNAKYPQKEVSE